MTDERVRTRFATDGGVLSFQEYFVRERLAPALRAIEFEGIDSARPTAEVLAALAEADLVVIGPSNPLISIAPILKVIGPNLPRDRTVAITPDRWRCIAEGPDGGDAAEPWASKRRRWRWRRCMQASRAPLWSTHATPGLRARIEELGYRTLVYDTVMDDGGSRLAVGILAAFEGASADR